MWWEGNIFLSHGSNLSGGIAIIFGKNINMTVVSTFEIEKCRALALQLEIMGLLLVFINIYAPNNGTERIRFFRKMNDSLKGFYKGVVLVLGGDWNCTLDRNGEEPCPPSVTVLSNIIRDYDLIDVWREHHPMARQYTWVNISSDHISSARLDRFYISRSKNNSVKKSVMSPNGFKDHHLFSFELSLKKI